MGNGVDTLFFDSWTWLIFISVGLFLILLELLFGVDTGLDLVFVGTAFILGGLITVAFRSWILSTIISGVICVSYIVIGRRYLHRHTAINAVKTNIDTIIGKSGVAMSAVTSDGSGIVRIGNEDWRARSDEDIVEGERVTVMDIKGVTLTVRKEEGENQ